MLGRLRVEGAGGAALPRRARQVLGVLAARHDRLVTKDALADAVWGDDLPGNHVAALEQYVSLLRKTLQPGRGRAGSFIVTGDGGYRFSTERHFLLSWVGIRPVICFAIAECLQRILCRRCELRRY